MLYVRVMHIGRSLRDVEDDCRAAGLVSTGATYEPDYPLYGHVATDKLKALKAVPGVVDVIILD